MASPADLRRAAETCLTQAHRELSCIPVGRVATDVMLAHSTKAQALATMALTQAVLALSQEQPEGGNDREA